jgi:ATP-dependent RNA helicase DDX24/MAK5
MQQRSTLEKLCDTLRFRSKNPKVIDLTEEDSGKMPETLTEFAARCKVEEKDLYLYYFLQQKKGESVIIFSNSITATRRLNSLLDFLKIKNQCLHSKMQQRQRLKNLDRFKKGVNEIESGGATEDHPAILVCTDVAARGLDIPYVANVVHYQCPFNAEVYVHRCGRTARIGREGESLALLSPDDNKNFKSICQVLAKKEEDFNLFDVKYSVLEKIRPLIDQAKDIEKNVHRSRQDEKAANWMIGVAKEAELELDEGLQHELRGKLSKKLREANKDIFTDERFKDGQETERKRETKQRQKELALKEKYDREIQA